MQPSAFVDRELIASLTAKMLLEIKAVHFRSDEPYMLTSGLASPVYIDCRKLISYPRIRSTLMDFAVSILQRDAGFEKFDAVAGGETAGIPFSAWIADRMELPMQYVRKKPKGFGRDAQIEGNIEEGQNVLLVEDLTTDGGSKLKFCDAIRKAGAECTDTFVVFFYDIFPETRPTLAKHGVTLHALAT
ncbi:MAG: orotate phosphoribosyltransferase, partial [Alphaproteobacteria bacterium]